MGLRPGFARLEEAFGELLGSPRRAHREYAETELRHLPAAQASHSGGLAAAEISD